MNSIVIGSGFGGIAAALRLKAKGHDVTLIEKHPDLGGRARVFKRNGFKFPKVTSKFSYISKYSKLAEGTLVCHHVVINSGVRIGVNCIINNKALIEHDVIIGNHCHISTGALINGGVVIGSNTFIGSGTIIKENVKIGSDCVVGAGLTIKKNIKSNSLVK